ncbi:LysR family transcriptional regulator [Aeromonas veronii]|uniref:LysR family transcriptional regulator n=1 Tax=Aeromonas TaxID=642 RepID=UPI001E5F3C96|nr:LysR family transcriptional regulator [Aeromonas veronii]MCD6616942.1 LysR family transcriptional regulator [Aeromonas veronii]MCJ7975371.1 LysR family transcriptional regulator [Aeromonas veronii]UOR20214.1 LysR family transcriptional regulator [Aeromonas veronii]
MKFDLRQLQAFVTLADTANYREAASRLFITQPALTKQIQGLEQTLGCTLFKRGRHGAELTALGAQLLTQASALVKHGREFERHALAVASGVAGRLKIGFGLSSFALAPALVASFKQQVTDVMIHLQDMPSAIQQEQLLSGQLQLGFMRRPQMPQLQEHRLLIDRLVLAVPTRMTEPDPAAFDVQQALTSQPLLQMVGHRCPGLSQQIAGFLGANRLTGMVQEAEDIQTLVALVAAGIGNAILPRSVSFIAGPDVTLYPLSGPSSEWEVSMVWNPDFADPIRDHFVRQVIASHPLPVSATPAR